MPNPAPLQPPPAWRILGRYLAAVRPGFLSITLCGCFLGFATALHDGVAARFGLMTTTVLLALLVHAAVNVLNDYCDHMNGCDAANTERIAPYTGGSRMIQEGLLSPLAMRRYALVLSGFAVLGGLTLAAATGPGLFWIGLVGVGLGWAYSTPPLALNCHGLGEVTVALCFLLVVVGADYVLRQDLAATPWLFGLNYALLTSNILIMNQFPDAAADAAAGKRHWVVRLGRQRAHWLYFALLSGVTLLCLLQASLSSSGAWLCLSLLTLLPAARAACLLYQSTERATDLQRAIEFTLIAAHAHSLGLALLLVTIRAP